MSRQIGGVKGGRELDAYLAALPKRMEASGHRQGLTAAAKPVRDEARRLAPKDTGTMARGIKTGSARKVAGGFSISVRLTGKHAYIGWFHEFGTAKMAAHPFMRPALDTMAEEAVAAYGAKIREFLSGKLGANFALDADD